MPFPGLPPDAPGASTRPASTSGPSSCPRAWPGRRVVLHVGAAESVLHRPRSTASTSGSARTRTWRRSSTSPTAVRPGPNDAALRGREVVGRDLHRGPGPVVARRHHPLGLPVRDGAGPPRGRRGDRRPRRRPSDRDARPDVDVGFAGVAPSRAGRSRRRSPACSTPAAAEAPARPPGAPQDPIADLMRRHIVGGRRGGRRRRGRVGRAADRQVPPLVGRVACRPRVPDVEPWSAETPTLYPLDRRRCAPRTATVVEEADAPDRLPAGRDPRASTCCQRRRVCIRGVNRHDFDQHTGRVVSLDRCAPTSSR